MPDPQTLSVDDFAQKIKAKYPDYASVDNALLVQKITEKHPEYNAMISEPSGTYDFGPAGTIKGAKVNGRPATREEAFHIVSQQRGVGQELGENLQRKRQDVSNYIQAATNTDQQTKGYMGDLAQMGVLGGAANLGTAMREGSIAPMAAMRGAIADYKPTGNIPALAKRYVLGNTVGRVPGASLLGESFERPTFKDFWNALKPDPQMQLFRKTPKLGETRTNVQPSLSTAPTAMVNPLERPFVAAPAAEFSSVDLPRSTIPHTNSGEAVMTQALTALDQSTLLKIARSRSIDVAAESQLKPGASNSRIIKKILNDFSPEELEEARSQGLEVSRNIPSQIPSSPASATQAAAQSKAAAEAWHVKVLSTFFPDVSVPKAMEARARSFIAQRPGQAAAAGPQPEVVTNESDLGAALQKSIEAQKAKGVTGTVAPKDFLNTIGGAKNVFERANVDLEAKFKDAKEWPKDVPPVEIERDAQGNVIGTNGRYRAALAERAGIKRIPVITKRATQ